MTKMKVNGQGEYSDLITRYFQNSFPEIAVVKGKDLLEILTTILVGSKNLRYGSMPSPENLVTIRKTIFKAVEMGLPIPVLIPWGGRKMDVKLKLDVAEVSALRQLLAVDQCIRKVYSPGLQMRVRIEDLNAIWLYKSEEGVEEYSEGMKTLIDMLKGDTKIIGVRESEMMNKQQYLDMSEEYALLINAVLTLQLAYPSMSVWDMDPYKELVSKGWKGEIPKEQREYYLDRYKRMDEDLADSEATAKLADYFGGSKTRYDLNGRGNPVTEVGSFIQINFSHPVPGAPEGIFNNTLYYRTIPGNMARTHIAPWRAKGYLQISESYNTPKLVFPGTKISDIIKGKTLLVDENDENKFVEISTDHVYQISLAEAMPYIMM
mgnify:FL=1